MTKIRISALDRSLLIFIYCICMIKFAVNLEGRPKEIFVIVVDEFIKTAKPVGSKFLAENYNLEVSSATIRNDLAFLEELGLLAKPHTSGGRIPTSNGWHYFIEEVRGPDELSSREMARLNALTNKLLSTSQEMMSCVSKIFPEVSDEFFKKFLIEKLFNENKHGRRK